MRSRLALGISLLALVGVAALPSTSALARRRTRAKFETYSVFTAPGVPASRLTFTIGNASGGVDQALTCLVGALADDHGARLDLPVGKRVSVTWADDATPAARSFVVTETDATATLEIEARGTVTTPDAPPEATSIVTIDSDALYTVGLPITKIVVVAQFGDRRRIVINNVFDEPGELLVVRFVPGIYTFQYFDRDGELVGPSRVLFLEGEQDVGAWTHLLNRSATARFRFIDDSAIDAQPVLRIVLTPLSEYARREVINSPDGGPWEPSLSNTTISQNVYPGTYRVDTYDGTRQLVATQVVELAKGTNAAIPIVW